METLTQLPRRSRGRQKSQDAERYQAEVKDFCDLIKQIQCTLDFNIGSRGWGYVFEGKRVIDKGDFDTCQRLINDCRKDGNLPWDICVEDDGRAADNLEELDENIEEKSKSVLWYVNNAYKYYNPISYWNTQKYYVQMIVEKIDLKSLFSKVCKKYSIPIINACGWSDINSRIRMAQRFREWEEKGKICVLLYCGDFDPAGLHISDFIIENFRQVQGATGWDPSNLIIDRFGLNYDFIIENNLTWIDNLETSRKSADGKTQRLDDPNHRHYNKSYVQDYIRKYGVRKCEANALVVRPAEGRELCRQSILKYIDQDGETDYNRLLEEQRELLKKEISEKLLREVRGLGEEDSK